MTLGFSAMNYSYDEFISAGQDFSPEESKHGNTDGRSMLTGK